MDSPLTKAHQHATNAEAFLSRGLLIKASEEHKLAADAFRVCVDASSDENRKRTFRLLYNENMKAEKELQRKIAKLRQDNKDPSLPQKLNTPRKDSSFQSDTTRSTELLNARRGGMSDSKSVDESFMVLGQRSDPGDAFTAFWNIMEGMEGMLPVAFASAPLGNEPTLPAQSPSKKSSRKDVSSSSDTDLEDPMVTRISRRIGMGKKLLAGASKSKGSSASCASKTVADVPEEDFDEDFASDGGDELSESFCLIPSEKAAYMSKILPAGPSLQQENGLLKAEVESMQKRLAAAERVLQLRKEQDLQLRDSIVMAKREAHRAMGASALIQRPAMDFASGSPLLNLGNSLPMVAGSTAPPPLPLPLPIPPLPMAAAAGGRDREPQLLRRIRELEDEVRAVKLENDKQKAMITKFRERWDKLKESAKRKKDARAAATTITDQRIEEEPEAEAEQDEEKGAQ